MTRSKFHLFDLKKRGLKKKAKVIFTFDLKKKIMRSCHLIILTQTRKKKQFGRIGNFISELHCRLREGFCFSFIDSCPQLELSLVFLSSNITKKTQALFLKNRKANRLPCVQLYHARENTVNQKTGNQLYIRRY